MESAVLIFVKPRRFQVCSFMFLSVTKNRFSGFLHAHISSLNEDSGLNLILLTTDRTAFFAMSELRSKLLEVILAFILLF